MGIALKHRLACVSLLGHRQLMGQIGATIIPVSPLFRETRRSVSSSDALAPHCWIILCPQRLTSHPNWFRLKGDMDYHRLQFQERCDG